MNYDKDNASIIITDKHELKEQMIKYHCNSLASLQDYFWYTFGIVLDYKGKYTV